MGSSLDTLKDSTKEIMSAKNKKLAVAKVVAKSVMNAMLDPSIIDVVIITTFLTIPVGLCIGIAVITQSFMYGKIFNDSSAQCYMARDSRVTERIQLSSKGYNLKGTIPKNHSEIGQITSWVDTGLVTTGDPLEVAVEGKWFPWGEEDSKHIYQIVQKLNSTYKIKDSDKVMRKSYEPEYVSESCKLTNSFEAVKANFNSDSKFDIAMRQNQISRYARTENNIRRVNQQTENIVNAPCYLENGYGVYMKIGEGSRFAYHIVNHTVESFEYRYDNNEGVVLRPTLPLNNTRLGETVIPFSLPTKIYDQTFNLSKPINITHLNPRLVQANKINTPYAELAEESLCNADIADRLMRPNETCSPPSKQKIYLAVNDILYTANEGILDITFASGVQRENVEYVGGLRTKQSSILQQISSFILNPLFGNQDITRLAPGELIDFTQKESGIIVKIRNNFLRNSTFQTIRMLLVILTITMLGYNVVKGSQELNFDSILKQILAISIALWGTEPDTYVLIDEVIVPFFFHGLVSLFSAFFIAASQISGMSMNTVNPFAIFDIIIEEIFSPVLGYRILAGFVSEPMFMVTMITVFTLIIAFAISAFRAFLTTIVAVTQSAMIVAFMPLALLLMIYSKTSEYMQKLISTIEAGIVKTMLFLLMMTILFFIAIGEFNKTLGYSICWQEIFSINIFEIFSIKFYGWKTIGTFSREYFILHLVTFAISVSICTKADIIMSHLADLTGGTGLYSSGSSMIQSFLGAAQVVFKPIQFILPKKLGGDYIGDNLFEVAKTALRPTSPTGDPRSISRIKLPFQNIQHKSPNSKNKDGKKNKEDESFQPEDVTKASIPRRNSTGADVDSGNASGRNAGNVGAGVGDIGEKVGAGVGDMGGKVSAGDIGRAGVRASGIAGVGDM
ncbi:MAG: hypothetical protein JJW01_03090, partial [Alphaproteobacteria bacterium]|nr:hypothetical protein [Rickettsiales bacterium]